MILFVIFRQGFCSLLRDRQLEAQVRAHIWSASFLYSISTEIGSPDHDYWPSELAKSFRNLSDNSKYMAQTCNHFSLSTKSSTRIKQATIHGLFSVSTSEMMVSGVLPHFDFIWLCKVFLPCWGWHLD